MHKVEAYIGLGSNLQDPEAQITQALHELHEAHGTRLLTTSSLYKSKPMGVAEQPDFINAVAKISTSLDPEALLIIVQGIEQQHQRVRSTDRWGPRTLDLDILLYGDQQINTEKLKIPHSGIAEREFVLIPLQEIEAHLIIPGKGALSELIKRLPPYQLTKIATTNVES